MLRKPRGGLFWRWKVKFTSDYLIIGQILGTWYVFIVALFKFFFVQMAYRLSTLDKLTRRTRSRVVGLNPRYRKCAFESLIGASNLVCLPCFGDRLKPLLHMHWICNHGSYWPVSNIESGLNKLFTDTNAIPINFEIITILISSPRFNLGVLVFRFKTCCMPHARW